MAMGCAGRSIILHGALRLVDVALAAAVDGIGGNSPPASPADGQCFILGAAPTGAWAGHALAIAGYGAGGWRFVEAVAGLTAFDKASGQVAVFDGTAWTLGTVKGAKLMIGGN